MLVTNFFSSFDMILCLFVCVHYIASVIYVRVANCFEPVYFLISFWFRNIVTEFLSKKNKNNVFKHKFKSQISLVLWLLRSYTMQCQRNFKANIGSSQKIYVAIYKSMSKFTSGRCSRCKFWTTADSCSIVTWI